MQSDKPDLFELLNTWAKLLPKEGEYNSNTVAKLNQVGSEIKQICAQVEQNGKGGFLLNSTPLQQEEIKTQEQQQQHQQNEQKKSESVYKPTFMFQLDHDTITTEAGPKFKCVYDFCQALEQHCQNSPNSHLNIEKDWLKLILSCSAHNYDRFMWIHTTFQAANNLKLNWYQVKRRLMCQYDDPSRHVFVSHKIAQFKYLAELETIEQANIRIHRLADEASISVIDSYIQGLPISIQLVLSSTVAYDKTTNFQPDLNDVQQRAVVLLNAKEGDFIFYSKSAHVALCLDYTKVDTKECEFHVLQNHTTTTCPDYIIVRYPYMQFTPLAVLDTSNQTLLAITAPLPLPPPSVALSPNGVSQQQPPKMNGTVNGSTNKEKENYVTQTPIVTEVTSLSPPVNAPVSSSSSSLIAAVTTIPAANGELRVKQEPGMAATTNGGTKQTAAAASQGIVNTVNKVNATAQSIEEHVAKLTTLQVVNRAREFAEKGQDLPAALKQRILEIKEQLERNMASPIPAIRSDAQPIQTQQAQVQIAIRASPIPNPITHTSSYGESSHTSRVTSYRPVSPPPMHRPLSPPPPPPPLRKRRAARSPSPRYKSGHRSPTQEDNNNDEPEIGCYYHGVNSSHTTKECRIEIKRRRKSSASPPPLARRTAVTKRGGGGGQGNDEENICIFCHLPFKAGHLAYCKEVRSKKPPRR